METMTRADMRLWKILAVLVALLGISIYYNGRTTTVTTEVYKPRAAAAPRSLQDAEFKRVSQNDELPEVDLLRSDAPEFTDTTRNLFEFGNGSSGEAMEDSQSEPIQE